MAIDPEELQRRREQRRQYQAAKRRRLWIRLGIAALVLVLCAVLIFVLLPKLSAPQQDNSVAVSTQPSEQFNQTEETAEATEPPASTTIHLALAGDVNVTDKVVNAGGPEYNYTTVFMDVAHIMAEADLSLVNFEGNLCGAPYGSNTVSAPQQLVEALASIGVDAMQLANSYSISKGLSGLFTTINNVRAAGMEPLGVFADQAAYKKDKGYTIQTVQGIKIAFVAFTKGMDGMALPPGNEDCVNILYSDYESTYQDVNTEKITTVLDAVAQEKPDITIAMLHWGSEYNDTISSSQESIVSLMLDRGVDAIIGTHPHYVQKMVYDEDDGTFIAYSLGDFLGDAEKSGTQYSVILDLEITKDNRTGNAKVSGYSYTPIYTVTENRTELRIVRIHEAMAAYEDSFIGSVPEEAYNDMSYALSRIEDRISGAG